MSEPLPLRYPTAGAFYYTKQPLQLIEAVDVGDPPLYLTVRTWNPYASAEVGSIFLDATSAVYLWHDVTIDRTMIPGITLTPGDVWLTETDQLWFVGPRTTQTHIHALSTWRFTDLMQVNRSTLYQPGLRAQGKSSFERVLEDQL